MTCVYKEYEVKNGTGAMTTAKNFLQGYNMKIAISCGDETLPFEGGGGGGGVLG